MKGHIGGLKTAQASRYLMADAALYVKDTIEDFTSPRSISYHARPANALRS